jgi:hypothetical protein
MMKNLFKTQIIFILLFFSSEVMSGGLKEAAWEFFKDLAIDTAVAAVQANISDTVTNETVDNLSNKIDKLEDKLPDYSPSFGRTPEYESVKDIIKNTKLIIGGLQDRMQNLEDKTSNLEDRVNNIESILKGQIQDTSGHSFESFGKNRTINLTGEWRLTDTIIEGPFKGLQIGFKMNFTQEGDKFNAVGEKYWENNKEISIKQRIPLSISGILTDNVIRGTYEENGLKTNSGGEFIWVSQTSSSFIGSFVSSTGSKGKSELIKND